ncbi:PDDEXK-like family protein [Isachenkonia alkalipeptolytica]|uniref:PD-(D/E)XK nuclease superfamily protein n=1 Tax=Isachenkonia alkalipeptolytica TaxID=2565777 RepID=A0AA43XKV9_9CLOT|nr:PD-(D/E)XK nuclease family protein [Isachenkonia alkalipeptolytica]NBG88119.1 hypothetical protein [Isachenkonia alkalipeptolytica]
MAVEIEGINSLESSMKVLDKIVGYLPERKKKTKTIPSIFSKSYDENFISDFLAYILDPNINGIGNDPLVKLIENYCGDDEELLKILDLKECNTIEVTREFTFRNKRRLDILIQINNELIIAIENKVFSNESENQTLSYTNSIHEKFPEHKYLFLYLTPAGKIPASKDFQPISYSQLADVLKRVTFDYREGIRENVIFQEFILHVEEYIMGKSRDKISEHTKLYLEYEDTINKLKSAHDEDAKVVFEEFEELVEQLFKDDETWVYNLKHDRGYQQIYKKHWNRKGLFIHHEFLISSKNILTENNLQYMIDVEGKDKEKFFALFHEEYEKIWDSYYENGFKYRPDKRGIAIIYKEIGNPFRLDSEDENKMIEELSNWKIIEEAIEKALSNY